MKRKERERIGAALCSLATDNEGNVRQDASKVTKRIDKVSITKALLNERAAQDKGKKTLVPWAG